jgi:[acyl-carrier-protein] S-malonyltransferase
MIALVFPGQGSQRAGMGAPWRDHPSWSVVDRLSESTGSDLAQLLIHADADTLRQTGNAQPATFALSLMILDAARGGGLLDVAPVAVAGHSLGEYSALVAAGVLSEADGGRLVAARAAAMQSAADSAPGTMAAVLGLDAATLAEACQAVEGAWMANDNAPGQIVVAGTVAGVEAVGEAAKALGAKRVIALPVGGAFHSPLMAPAQARLDEALATADFLAATIQVVANVDAEAHTEGFDGLLSAQLVLPVRWRESLEKLASLGATTFVELGPGTELSGMVKRTVPGAARVNVATPDDLDKLAAAGEAGGAGGESYDQSWPS